MLQTSQVVLTVLLLCDALAAPIVPKSDTNRKMATMEVTVRFAGTRIERVPLEKYVAAVLASESGNFESEEALKAMAVAVRSYALHFRDRHREAGFDFCDTTHCQDLRHGSPSERTIRAAEETAGQLLWYDKSPAAAYYNADCGGRTEAAGSVWGSGEPYLKGRVDRYCARRGNREWRSSFSKGLVQQALAGQGIDAPPNLQSVEVVQRTDSGRASRILLHGASAIVVKIGTFQNAMQRALGWKSVPSSSFTVERHADQVVLSGKGSGHAVGLCQSGAEQMGEEGKSYRQILAYYYPGTTVAR
jgi:stage II sporulation protein D